MSGLTCLRLVERLDLPVTITGIFCSIFNNVTGKNLEIISQNVLWHEHCFRIEWHAFLAIFNKYAMSKIRTYV